MEEFVIINFAFLDDEHIAIETEDIDGVENLIRWVSFFDNIKIQIGDNYCQRGVEFIVKCWDKKEYLEL